MRLWYARRGIPWVPFLACLLLTPVMAVPLQRWPQVSPMLLPGVLTCCACAAGFVFDEPAAAAATVTPRGGRWALTTRCSVVAVPIVLWLTLVATLPSSAPVDRSSWAVAGPCCQLLALCLAWIGSRSGVATPGAGVAGAVAVMTLAPFVAGPFVGWTPI